MSDKGDGRIRRAHSPHTLRRVSSSYAVELAIVLLGSLAGAGEAIFANNTDIALLVVLISSFLALAVAAIRQDISSELRSASVEARLLDAIPDDRWRREAATALDRQRAEFAAWAAGTRTVAERSSLNYQIDVVKTAERSVCAVHLALDDDALAMWADPQRGFARLVDAYRGLPDQVRCRRVLDLDEASPLYAQQAGQRLIIDPGIQGVCRTQTQPRDGTGLGFDLRVQWVKKTGRSRIADLLVVDDREACTIDGQGSGRFGDLIVSVNQAVVQAHIRSFEDLWTAATPVEHCLPAEAPPRPQRRPRGAR